MIVPQIFCAMIDRGRLVFQRKPFGPLLVRSLFAAILASAPVSAAWAGMFNPESFTLPNGLQVVVISNHRVPVVSHMMWYKVGAADESAGKTGLAHMVEHMMFKGTRTVPAGQFSHLVAINGGRENAFTTADYTAYYQNVAVEKLGLVMKLEADRMANLALRDGDFQPERQVVLEERRMRIDNQPEALLSEQMEAALFLNGPYHHPVIGWRSDIESYSLSDVAAFHQSWYVPNNAILIIAGDVTIAQVKPLAERYYGAIKPRPLPQRLHLEEPEPIAQRSLIMRDPDLHQPSWSRLYLAPSYHKGATAQAYPLQVLAEILGGGSTSRLYKNLVVEKPLAASIGASYDPDAIGMTRFSFYASPRPEVTIEQLEAAILAQIQAVTEQGVSDEEVAQAKQRLSDAVTYLRDSYQTGAHLLGQALASGASIAEEESWPERINEVTTAQVTEAARAILRDERSVTGHLLPTSADANPTDLDRPAPAPRQPGGLSGRELR